MNDTEIAEAQTLIAHAEGLPVIEHLPSGAISSSFNGSFREVAQTMIDLAAALRKALDERAEMQTKAWQDGLKRGALIGATELCIYCANNRPVTLDNGLIPSYIHIFKDNDRVYVCAASSIWLGVVYGISQNQQQEGSEATS